MRRKHILESGILGVLAAILIVAGSACKSSTTAVNPPEEKSFISSSSQSHTHSVQVTRLAIESTPADGYSHATSLVNSHVHTFTLSQSQLQSLKGGATLNIDTSTDSGHFHTFTIQKWF
jgi:uncharacterized lipoprotein YajG